MGMKYDGFYNKVSFNYTVININHMIRYKSNKLSIFRRLFFFKDQNPQHLEITICNWGSCVRRPRATYYPYSILLSEVI